MKNKALILVAALTLAATQVFAGVVILMQTKESDASADVYATKMQISGRDLRMDVKGAGDDGLEAGMIYRGSEQKMWSLDHAQRNYMEMDKSMVNAMADQMTAAMKELEAQMANMPAEQREMMKSMMGDSMPAMEQSKPKTEVKKTGEKRTINGYPCVKYDIISGGQKKVEVWATSWKDAGISKDSFDVFEDLADFYSEMLDAFKSSPMGGMDMDPFSQFDEIDGVPILTRNLDGAGRVIGQTTTKAIKETSVSPDLFDIPAGYSPMQMPSMGGGF